MHEADATLVERAARGDRRAFAALVARHEARLRHFLSRIVGAADADDVAQEALVKAWLALPRYRAEGLFAAWLAAIGWRAALDHQRRDRRTGHRENEWIAEIDNVADGPGTAPLELERALAALTGQERAALVLTHGHGWSHAEAAKILGLPLGTLKSLAARARARARAELEGATRLELETAA